MNRFIPTVLVFVILASSQAAEVTAPSLKPEVVTPAYLHQLFERARTNHPGLRAAAARHEAAQHNTRSVRSWEDPMFKFGGAIAADRGPMLDQEGDLIYEWEQKLPVFGLPKLERAMAAAEETGAGLQADFQAQTLRRDLALQLYQTALAQRQVELTQQELGWLDTLVSDATERFRSGIGSSVDVLRVQNERDRRSTQLQGEENEVRASWARLNRLMNQPAETAWPTLQLPALMGPLAYSEKLAEMALSYEPKLKVMQQDVRVAEAATRLADRRRLPEVVASVEGRQYSGDGGFREGMFKLGFSVPWFNRNRYREERRREESRRQAAEAEAHDYRLEIRQEVQRLTAAADTARHEALLYHETILPRTRQALETLRANWLAGRGMLTDVLDTRREWVDGQRMEARAIAEQYRMLSDLVLCCGLGDLAALERLGVTPASTPSSQP